jgi:hypothetical protein
LATASRRSATAAFLLGVFLCALALAPCGRADDTPDLSAANDLRPAIPQLFFAGAEFENLPAPPGAGQLFPRSLRSLPPRIVLTGKVVVFAFALAAVMRMDQGIRDEVQERRSPTLERWEKRIEPLGHLATTSLAALSLWGGGALAGNEKQAETGRIMAESLLVANVFNLGSRWAFSRSRPGAEGKSGAFFTEGDHAFPSGHATRAFAIATVLSERYGQRAAWIAYPLATLLGVSRVVADSHWASDVVAGAAMGHVAAAYICRRHGSARGEDHAVRIVPEVSLGSRPAAGVLFDIRLGPR